jgi:hypothetical protein
MRQGFPVRAEARVEAEGGNRGSSGAPVWLRWRAEQELGGREAFNNTDSSAADWTAPKRVSLFGRRLCC